MSLPPAVRLSIVAAVNHVEEIVVTQPVLVGSTFVETPVNLDGWMLKATMQKAGVVELEKSTVDGGIEILDQSAEETRGHARIHFRPMDTAFMGRVYEWLVRGWDPSGAVKALQRGSAVIGVGAA